MKDKTEMNQADVIEKEISTLAARREALATDATTAQGELERQRKSLVAGKAGVAEVTTAQLTHTTLTEAVRDIDSQLTALRQELAQSQAAEERESKLARLVQLAAAGTKAFADYQALAHGLNAALLEWAKRLGDSQTAIGANRRDFIKTFAETVPGAHMHPNWSPSDPAKQRQLEQDAAELLGSLRARGADLDVVLSNMFGDRSQIDTYDLQQRMTKTEPFGEMFLTILRVADNYERQNAPPSEPSERIGVVGRGLNLTSDTRSALRRHDHAA